MKTSSIILVLMLFQFSMAGQSSESRFDLDKDLLLLNYDCKTDVDDLHSIAAFATLSSNEKYSSLNYHPVAGTFGIQEGRYVPPNPLFEMAFGNDWSDAHAHFARAVDEVSLVIKKTLEQGGKVWIAEAGQSDFTSKIVKKIKMILPEVKTKERIHVVQHSDWNEEVTSSKNLEYVKLNTAYHKIPDGNVVGNGTPGFRSPDFKDWNKKIKDNDLQKIWQLAIQLGNQFNGKDGRYNNEAIAAGGLDFSDLSEVCWILGLEDIEDTEEFFERFAK